MTSELLKELMLKVSALQGDVSALQQQAPGKGSGKKRARDGDADGDEMPGSSRDGVDYQESEAGSDPELMEDPDNEGDGLPLQISEEGQAFWRLPLGLGLNSLQGKRSWKNMERQTLFGSSALSYARW